MGGRFVTENADIKNIIGIIIDRLEEKHPNLGNIYRDEPIIKTASQMKNYLPPQYIEMKRLITIKDFYKCSYEQLFLKQAEFMAYFEDSFEYSGIFNRYYPTYRDMSDYDLRGYFSWRTELRHGNIKKTNRSFVFIYMYELLNLTGGLTAEQGYDLIKSFTEQYKKTDPSITNTLYNWLFDFIIYYGLNPVFLETVPKYEQIKRASILWEIGAAPKETAIDAISSFSDYNTSSNQFAVENSEDIKIIVYNVFKAMCDYFEKHRKNSYPEKCIGKMKKFPYAFFNGAVFCKKDGIDCGERKINACFFAEPDLRNGSISLPAYYKNKSREIGLLFKTAEAVLREKINAPRQVIPPEAPKMLIKTTEKITDDYLKYKKKHTAKKIEIDLSQLDSIREISEITKNRLIIEEEQEENISSTNNTAPLYENAPQLPKTETPENCGILTAEEFTLIKKLLAGEDYKSYTRQCGLMLSVTADSINEKLFDYFGDTVIEFNSEEPCIIEDYTEELKGILNI